MDYPIIHLQNPSKFTDIQMDQVRRTVHPKLRPFHFRRIICLTRIIQRITRLLCEYAQDSLVPVSALHYWQSNFISGNLVNRTFFLSFFLFLTLVMYLILKQKTKFSSRTVGGCSPRSPSCIKISLSNRILHVI